MSAVFVAVAILCATAMRIISLAESRGSRFREIVRTLELLVPKFAKCRIGAKYRRVKKCPLICILQDRGYF